MSHLQPPILLTSKSFEGCSCWLSFSTLADGGLLQWRVWMKLAWATPWARKPRALWKTTAAAFRFGSLAASKFRPSSLVRCFQGFPIRFLYSKTSNPNSQTRQFLSFKLWGFGFATLCMFYQFYTQQFFSRFLQLVVMMLNWAVTICNMRDLILYVDACLEVLGYSMSEPWVVFVWWKVFSVRILSSLNFCFVLEQECGRWLEDMEPLMSRKRWTRWNSMLLLGSEFLTWLIYVRK